MSANPFKRLGTEDERQSLWERVTRFKKSEIADAEDVIAKAQAFLAWDNMPYSDSFKEWLQRQANQPAPIAEHLMMVGHAARAQAFLEVLAYLRSERSKSHVATGE